MQEYETYGIRLLLKKKHLDHKMKETNSASQKKILVCWATLCTNLYFLFLFWKKFSGLACMYAIQSISVYLTLWMTTILTRTSRRSRPYAAAWNVDWIISLFFKNLVIKYRTGSKDKKNILKTYKIKKVMLRAFSTGRALISRCSEQIVACCSNGSFLECSSPTTEARVRFPPGLALV